MVSVDGRLLHTLGKHAPARIATALAELPTLKEFVYVPPCLSHLSPMAGRGCALTAACLADASTCSLPSLPPTSLAEILPALKQCRNLTLLEYVGSRAPPVGPSRMLFPRACPAQCPLPVLSPSLSLARFAPYRALAILAAQD